MKFWENLTIAAPSPETEALARAHQDSRLKPLGALGSMEDWVIRLAGLTGKAVPDMPVCGMVVFAADNGLWEESVTPVPQTFTASQTMSMTRGMCGINVLCEEAGASLTVVDVGIRGEISAEGLVSRKVMHGTKNAALGPAMTEEECLAAMRAGFDEAERAAQNGITMLGVGEMGIGNTSTSACVAAMLLGLSPEVTVGRGTGLDDEGLAHKREVVRRVLRTHAGCENDAFEVLRRVGGLDIAAMAGCYIGCAACGIPAVVDGYIAMTAALAACRLRPDVRPWLFPSHMSAEPGAVRVAECLGFDPPLRLGLRLGEGSGCPLFFELMKNALALHSRMASLEEGAMPENILVDIRE